MLIVIDKSKCLGYACCVMAAPGLFEMDEEADVARACESDAGKVDRALLNAAIQSCPVRAIHVQD